jgi:hypothetical protein
VGGLTNTSGTSMCDAEEEGGKGDMHVGQHNSVPPLGGV